VIEHQIVEGNQLADTPLRHLGVPAYDIVRVRQGGDDLHVLLESDRQVVHDGGAVQ
jgi:hypothetical protein